MSSQNRNISTRVLNVVFTTAQLQEEPVVSTIISKGLAVYETTIDGKLKMKVGDGVNKYADLPYLSDPTVTDQIMNKLEALTNVLRIKGTVVDITKLNEVENPQAGDVYFVGNQVGSYAEYVRTTENTWEFIGQIAEEVDLSGYYNSSQIDTLLSGKANNTLSNFVDNKDASNITTTDTIASALSKVENQIKNKANDGSEITLTGYEKGTDKTGVVATDTLNSAVGKIENKLDDKLDVNDTYTFICTL